ncbi:hypothetical protein SVA_2626 [Sulfurifustis variabilis]|uniref:Lipoprotein n=1 Tax=Sulfurifustis variabilis TaxID=1675686 RepID=A0A1B4VB22_9GAMM|nr:hypothetical protein [Sulfurifustis variabilis]BAU49174.1 hypothetical protein SVA_2626 [Sulfurifustis variabilis]
MSRVATLAAVSLLLAGCAGGPSISELRTGTRTATFVQYGKEPQRYSFGVVDTSSFWAAYGGGVSAQLGGGALWTGLEASGRAESEKRAPTVTEVMRWLYNKNPMADRVSAGVMPKLAAAWGVDYEPSRLRVLEHGTPLETEDGTFKAFNPMSDVVLVVAPYHVMLTERQTIGRAFAAGFTMGTNTKNVTVEGYVQLSAYKRDASGVYKRVWQNACGVNNVQMDIDFPFPEVIKSQEKAKQLFDAATPKMIENCGQFLAKVK